MASAALRVGGKYLVQVTNSEHAERYFPKRDWDVGQNSISLCDYSWDESTRRMSYRESFLVFGQQLNRPAVDLEISVRLYGPEELSAYVQRVGLEVTSLYGAYDIPNPTVSGATPPTRTSRQTQGAPGSGGH